jgi:hypothetical protein
MTDIDSLGYCRTCNRWVLLQAGKDWLPDHLGKNGKDCPDSRYSPWKTKYRINTQRGAIEVARKLQNVDLHECYSGSRHSLACSDGDFCQEEKLKLARALAEYVINTIEKERP